MERKLPNENPECQACDRKAGNVATAKTEVEIDENARNFCVRTRDPNFEVLVLGCIASNFRKHIFVGMMDLH